MTLINPSALRRPIGLVRTIVLHTDRLLHKFELWAWDADPESVLHSLKLESASKHDIPNGQRFEKMSTLTVQNIRASHTAEYGNSITEVTANPTGIYNCHGLVFASRRSQLYGRDVRMILSDDHYTRRLAKNDVKPGDVVLFVASDGDIEHSGIVLEPPSASNAGMPKIVSKWGNFVEYAHYANQSTYNISNLEYYRVEWT